MTSRDVVNQVARLVRPAKAGHAGTLDPMATGVLVVCVGHATRLITFVQEGRKRYRARFVLGQQSDTDDCTGRVIATGDWSRVTERQLTDALPAFVGRILQAPPQFSAIHVQGRRAYDFARQGQSVELNARPVDVFSLHLTDFQLPSFELEIECGKGTYVRSIGRDLGSKLGCGAMLTELQRLNVGEFAIDTAVSVDRLSPETWLRYLQPAIGIVNGLRRRVLTINESVAIRCGRAIPIGTPSIEYSQPGLGYEDDEFPDSRVTLVSAQGEFVGIGEIDQRANQICPRIVFPAAT